MWASPLCMIARSPFQPYLFGHETFFVQLKNYLVHKSCPLMVWATTDEVTFDCGWIVR